MAQEVLSTFLDLLSSTNKRQVCTQLLGQKKLKVVFEFLFQISGILLKKNEFYFELFTVLPQNGLY